MKKLRLLLTSDCNRNCEGCCNKDWDLDSLPVCTDYSGYNEIMITGGEPMLYPEKIRECTSKIWGSISLKWDNIFKKSPCVYLYTAWTKRPIELIDLLMVRWIDGLTLTLHNQDDVNGFENLNERLMVYKFKYSLRLNVFKGVDLSGIDLSLWKVKDNIEWIKDCLLPEDEVFMRFE